MILVIAEKPSLGRAIAEAIGATGNSDPIKSGDYYITWIYGHIMGLKMPDEYDEKYSKWNLEDLPIYFEPWEQVVSEGKEQKANQIGQLLKTADYVIHAGDADDEGQLLVDELLRHYHYTGPVKRLQTADTTPVALSRALQNMDDNKKHEINGWAAYARSVSDLIVGVNMSRFFSCNNPGSKLTIGRVQTPTLGLVVNRDLQRESFAKIMHYTINAEVQVENKNISTVLKMDKEDSRLTDGMLLNKAEAERICSKINGIPLSNIKIEHKTVIEAAPLPFNLVKLQTYCDRKYHYDPTKVLNITQDLREKYAAITYNRSNCQYLSTEQYNNAPQTLDTVCRNIRVNPPVSPKLKSKAFNDEAITEHTAIIPTDKILDLEKMTEQERNVYSAIAKYYLVQFMPPAKKDKTVLTADIPGEGILTATSSVIIDAGYRKILNDIEDQDETSDLSLIPTGQYSGNVISANVQEKETKPPAPYTKASLNEDMTRIAKYVTDSEVKEILIRKDKGIEGENGSIGTPATRSYIIDNLVQRGFLEEQNRKLISTPLGREFYRILPDELKLADTTAKWWVIQESIKDGSADYLELPHSVLNTVEDILKQTYPKIQTAKAASEKSEKKVIGKCPRCGGDISEGKNAFGCSNWKQGCKFAIWKKSSLPIFSKITITSSMAKKLLDGETVPTDKLYSKQKDKTFYGGICMVDEDQDKSPSLKAVMLEHPVIGKCPRCGGDIIESNTGFGCSNWKDGCRFVIWKKPKSSVFQKVTISASTAKKLLNGDTVKSEKLYSAKTGKQFKGGFKLVETDSDHAPNLELVFDDTPPVSLGKCPRCGGEIVESKFGYGCSNWQDGCKFIIWKKPKSSLFKNITITSMQAKKLLQGESIGTDKLYSQKKDKKFSGAFHLEDKGSEYGPELVLDQIDNSPTGRKETREAAK